MLDDDFQPGVLEQEAKLGRVVCRPRRGKRLGFCGMELSSPEPPDRRRVGEEGGTPSEHARGVLDEEVHIVQPVLPAPRHRLAERTGGVVFDEHPALRSSRPGRSSRKRSRHRRFDAEVRADERGELRLKQRPTALGFERLEGGYDDFLRRP